RLALARSEPQWDIGPTAPRTRPGRANMRRMASAAPDRSSGPTTRSVVARFLAGTLVAFTVAVVGGYFALRAVAIDEAKRQTRVQVKELAKLVESTGLSDGLLEGRGKSMRRV